MHLKLYQVTVPDKTTRTFTVPEYDIDCIRLMWDGYLPTGKTISVEDTGNLTARNLHDEAHRVAREYSTQPKGGGGSTFKQVYQNPMAFKAAYEAAVRRGTEFFEKVEADKARAEQEAAQAQADKEAAAQVEAERLAREAAEKVAREAAERVAAEKAAKKTKE